MGREAERDGMSRLDFLRMKRTASSYGLPLTFVEQLELERLEADLDDSRHGRPGELGSGRVEDRRDFLPAETVVYEV
jgi:hypothetical protein